jgi:hypothetical protein
MVSPIATSRRFQKGRPSFTSYARLSAPIMALKPPEAAQIAPRIEADIRPVFAARMSPATCFNTDMAGAGATGSSMRSSSWIGSPRGKYATAAARKMARGNSDSMKKNASAAA